MASPQQQDPVDAALQGAIEADDALRKKKSPTKEGVSKSHLDIQSGYDKALDAVLRAEKEKDVIANKSFGKGLPFEKLANVKQRVAERMNSKDPHAALRLADDFRHLAGLGQYSPETSKAFLSAAEQLTKAYEGEQLLKKERSPGGALALTPPELQTRKEDVEGRLVKAQEGQKTVGEFGAPEARQQVESVLKERQNVQQYEKLLTPAVSDDNPDVALNSVGVPRKDFVGSAQQAVNKLKGELGEGFDLEKPVSFKYGLPLVVGALGPEAQVEFSTWARQELARKRKEEADASAKSDKASDLGSKGQPEAEVGQTRARIEGNFAQQQMVRQEFAKAQEFQSWTAIIAYAILSVLIGPRGAFVFFSNAKQKNTLGMWLDQLKAEMKDLQQQEEYEKREQEYSRREAARQSYREQEKVDTRQHDIYKLILNHQLILKRAQAGGINRDSAKKISSDFSRYATLADDARAEITQQDKILESLTSSDAMKRNAAKIKEQARQQLEQYKEKMRQINDLLEGGVPAAAGEGEE